MSIGETYLPYWIICRQPGGLYWSDRGYWVEDRLGAMGFLAEESARAYLQERIPADLAEGAFVCPQFKIYKV